MNRNIFFPSTIVDGFFENPDAVRNFALEQEFFYGGSKFPGKRTRLLHEINPILLRSSVSKITNLFFEQTERMGYSCDASFQIVDGRFGGGWIHRDDPILFTAIIYLTPGSNQGTSLYVKKDPFIDATQWEDQRLKLFEERSNDINFQEKNNSLFEETINVKGIYNRMFLFDSLMNHGAHDFFGETDQESRLTMIMFFKKFTVDGGPYPISRMNMGFSPTTT